MVRSRGSSEPAGMVGLGAVWSRARAWLLLSTAIVMGCAVPQRIHDPLEYPETRLRSSGFELAVVDSRPSAPLPAPRQLTLARDFEARSRLRLAKVIGGDGPPVQVLVHVVAADELELVDARGEMTRVVVRLNIEVKVKDGPVLGRVETQSSSDLPRDEARPDEIALVLDATAENAFDRYWANPATTPGLNRELAAYVQRHPRASAP